MFLGYTILSDACSDIFGKVDKKFFGEKNKQKNC